MGNFPSTQTVAGTVAVSNHPVAAVTTLVSNTGAAGASVTITLPSAGAGVFHYITYIDIVMYNVATRTGSSNRVLVSTTNLPGTSTQFTFPSAGAIGTLASKEIALTKSLRSAVANTNTTVVCPATTNVIWQAQVHYYTGV